jgi:hypothetical protein
MGNYGQLLIKNIKFKKSHFIACRGYSHIYKKFTIFPVMHMVLYLIDFMPALPLNICFRILLCPGCVSRRSQKITFFIIIERDAISHTFCYLYCSQLRCSLISHILIPLNYSSHHRYSDWLRAQRPGVREFGAKNFHFPISSRPALGSTQPPIKWVPGALSRE